VTLRQSREVLVDPMHLDSLRGFARVRVVLLPPVSCQRIERGQDHPEGTMPHYVRELTSRKYRGRPPAPIRGPDDVVALVGRKLRKDRREQFVILLLNARHEVLRQETVSVGSLNASIVHPREVFRPAVVHSAASVVLVHNHPSGDPEPSEEDLSITRRLVEAGDLMGIGVLDHVIIAERGVVSFRSRQLL
jgi:DNA repair protein RadC